MDWVLDELESRAAGVLSRALQSVADSEPDEYIYAPAGEIALAAAEVVAALNGYPAPDLPWQAHVYIGRPATESLEGLKSMAIFAVNRTLAANSELEEAYREAPAEAAADWRLSTDDLLRRLSAPARERPRLGVATRWRLMKSQLIERLYRLFLR
jgi:hypothetical protein